MVSMAALTGIVAGGMTGVTLLVYANEVFGSATYLGIMYAGAGAGFLLGGVLYAIIEPRYPRRAMLLVSIGQLGLEPTLLWLAGLFLLSSLSVVANPAFRGMNAASRTDPEPTLR